MKKTTCILLTAFTVLLIVSLALPRLEGFGSTSPGTMVQLATSHVPTEEDEYYLRYIYPRMVNRDLIDMTGSGLF